jgi:hypothetical protein
MQLLLYVDFNNMYNLKLREDGSRRVIGLASKRAVVGRSDARNRVAFVGFFDALPLVMHPSFGAATTQHDDALSPPPPSSPLTDAPLTYKRGPLRPHLLLSSTTCTRH